MKKRFIEAVNKMKNYILDMFIPTKYDDNSDINLKIFCLSFSPIFFPFVVIGTTFYIILYTLFAEAN